MARLAQVSGGPAVVSRETPQTNSMRSSRYWVTRSSIHRGRPATAAARAASISTSSLSVATEGRPVREVRVFHVKRCGGASPDRFGETEVD